MSKKSWRPTPRQTLKEIKKNRTAAFNYLRGGSPLGGVPVELFIKNAADGLQKESGPDGIAGVFDARANVEGAMKRLIEVHGELSAAIARHQERLDEQYRKKYRKLKR